MRNSKLSSTLSEEDLKQQRNLIHWLTLGLTLLFLLQSASCANPPFQTPPRLTSCSIPTEDLQPTPVPPLNDATNQKLMEEANQLRAALDQCNRDKQKALKELQYQNKLRNPS